MKIYKTLLIGLLLISHSALNAESITALIRNNTKSIELVSNFSYHSTYSNPNTINSVRLDNDYLLINYTISSDGTYFYTYDIQIDLSTCIISKGIYIGNNLSNNRYVNMVAFESSRSNIIKGITYGKNSDRESRRGKSTMPFFRILCKSEYLMNQIYEASYNLTKVYMPKYPVSNEGIGECFNKIQSLFSEYIVKSVEVKNADSSSGEHKTTGIKLEVKNNNLIIKYTDSGTESRGPNKFYSGNKECIIPLSDAKFGYTGDGGISIESKQGIKKTDKNGTTIKNSTFFYTNTITCQDIVTNLIVLQELIKETSFNQILGVAKNNTTTQSKKATSKNNTTTQSKKETIKNISNKFGL